MDNKSNNNKIVFSSQTLYDTSPCKATLEAYNNKLELCNHHLFEGVLASKMVWDVDFIGTGKSLQSALACVGSKQ